jgi:hypothetical protein
MEKALSLPNVDWLIIWKIYHYRFIFCVYAALSVVIRLLMLRNLSSESPKWVLLLSWSASLLIVPAMFLLVLPGFALVFLIGGRTAVDSIFMAIPIALCIGLAGVLLDVVVLHLFRQPIGAKRRRLLFAANTLVAFLTATITIARELIHPTHMLAMLNSWR